MVRKLSGLIRHWKEQLEFRMVLHYNMKTIILVDVIEVLFLLDVFGLFFLFSSFLIIFKKTLIIPAYVIWAIAYKTCYSFSHATIISVPPLPAPGTIYHYKF
jgi:hypothetical protein